MRQLTGYIDRSGADLIVSQLGVRTMHMSASVLRPDIADRAREVPGVAWAVPIRYTTGIVSSPAGRMVTYVIGYDPAARTAARTGWSPAAPPTRRGRPGPSGRRPAPGAWATGPRARPAVPIAGLSTGGTNIANTTVFIPTSDFARLRGPTQAYVLVGAAKASTSACSARLEAIPPGTAS